MINAWWLLLIIPLAMLAGAAVLVGWVAWRWRQKPEDDDEY